MVAFHLPPPQPGRRSSRSGRAKQSKTIGAPRLGRRRARRDRGTSPHPSAHRRTRRREAALAPPARAACGMPRRSRPPTSRPPTPRGASGAAVRRILGRQRAELLDHLDHRPIRDPLPVGEAPPAEDPCVHTVEELGRKPRLPDARDTEDGEQLARTVVDRPFERLVQAAELALAPDHQRVEPSWRLVCTASSR